MEKKEKTGRRAGKKAEEEKEKKYSIAVLTLKKAGGGSAEKIADEASKLFSRAEVFLLSQLEIGAGKGTGIFCDSKNLKDFDCVYLRGSYAYARFLTAATMSLKAYMPIRPETFVIAHDKFLTLLALQKAGIEIPVSYLVYTTKAARELLDKIHYPIVFKLPLGTHGKGVMFAESKESASSIIDTLSRVAKYPLIMQEYIETGATDIRALVIGKKVFAMKRIAKKGELRAGIHTGATAEPYELDYDTKHMAIKAAKVIGADICAVDIMKKGEKAVVIEVNVSPGIEGISKALKKNIAKEIALFLAERTKEKKLEEEEKHYAALKEELEPVKEILTNLDIKGEIIRLPPAITRTAKIMPTDEVIIKIEKGKISIEKKE